MKCPNCNDGEYSPHDTLPEIVVCSGCGATLTNITYEAIEAMQAVIDNLFVLRRFIVYNPRLPMSERPVSVVAALAATRQESKARDRRFDESNCTTAQPCGSCPACKGDRQ